MKLWTIGDSSLTATVTPEKGEPKTLVYASVPTSAALVTDALDYVRVPLEPVYVEEMIETVERSRGLIDGGVKISFKLPESLGGIGFEFERKPQTEVKKIKRAIYKADK